MKEIANIMDHTCRTSIRGVFVIGMLLVMIQNLIALIHPDNDPLMMVIFVFLLLFTLLNLHHVRRCCLFVHDPMVQAWQQEPSKKRSLLMGEWIFTCSSYLFILVAQYVSWLLLYAQLQESFMIRSNPFYFFTLTQVWLHSIMTYHIVDVLLMLSVLGMLSIQFTFLHLSIALKRNRGISILLALIACSMVMVLMLASKGLPALYLVLLAIACFAYVELMDLLNVRRENAKL